LQLHTILGQQTVDFDDTGRALRQARRLRFSSIATAMLVVAVFSIGVDRAATRSIGVVTATVIEIGIIGVALAIVSAPLSRMLRKSIIELDHVREGWRQDAIRDALTGLFNRRHFDERLSEEIARSHRHGNALSLILIDIDHFKRLNDQRGHAVGDAALREVAMRMRSMLRREDVVSRIGGDELAVIMPDTPIEQAFDKAERLRMSFAAAPVAVPVTLSCGVCGLMGDMSAEAFLKCADESLYRAKQQRDTVAAVQLTR
jgi:diguanylate cyclase (GGDEF)-like protein